MTANHFAARQAGIETRVGLKSLHGFKLCAAALAAASLTGCAVSTPIEISSTGNVLPRSAAVSLLPKTDDGALAKTMRAAVSKAMVNHSVAMASDAPLVADVAVSIRPAAIGLANETPEVEWKSHARDKKWLDRCKAQRMRGSLVILQRSNGALVFRSDGEMVRCTFEQSDYDELAEQLVANATGTLKN